MQGWLEKYKYSDSQKARFTPSNMGTQPTLSVRRHNIRETIIPHRLKVVWLSLADEDEEIRVVKVHKLKSELASHLNVDIMEVFYTQTVTPNKGTRR